MVRPGQGNPGGSYGGRAPRKPQPAPPKKDKKSAGGGGGKTGGGKSSTFEQQMAADREKAEKIMAGRQAGLTPAEITESLKAGETSSGAPSGGGVDQATANEAARLREKYPDSRDSIREQNIRQQIEARQSRGEDINQPQDREAARNVRATMRRVMEINQGEGAPATRQEVERLRGSINPETYTRLNQDFSRNELARKYRSTPLIVDGKTYYGEAAAAKVRQLGETQVAAVESQRTRERQAGEWRRQGVYQGQELVQEGYTRRPAEGGGYVYEYQRPQTTIKELTGESMDLFGFKRQTTAKQAPGNYTSPPPTTGPKREQPYDVFGILPKEVTDVKRGFEDAVRRNVSPAVDKYITPRLFPSRWTPYVERRFGITQEQYNRLSNIQRAAVDEKSSGFHGEEIGEAGRLLGNVYAGSLTGATAGFMVGGPAGAAVGGVVGGGGGVVSYYAGREVGRQVARNVNAQTAGDIIVYTNPVLAPMMLWEKATAKHTGVTLAQDLKKKYTDSGATKAFLVEGVRLGTEIATLGGVGRLAGEAAGTAAIVSNVARGREAALAAKLPLGVRVGYAKIPGQRAFVVAKGDKVLFSASNEGAGFGSKAIKPLTLRHGEGFLPTTATQAGGDVQRAMLFSAAEKQTAFMPAELTRMRSGFEVMRELKAQPSKWERPFDITGVQNIPANARQPVEQVLTKYRDSLIIKGSSASATQTKPGLGRTPKDIDVGTLDVAPEKVRQEIITASRKAGVPVKEEGASVLFQREGKWEKGLDVMRREELRIEADKAPAVEGEFRFGLPVVQKPLRIGGRLLQPLSEQVLRKGSTAISPQRHGENYLVNPQPQGRIQKDIFDFQETVAPTLIESAKAKPSTLLRGVRAGRALDVFKATRGEDITTPQGYRRSLFFTEEAAAAPTTTRGRSPGLDLFKSKPPAQTKGKDVGGRSLFRVEYKEAGGDFFYASGNAYQKLFKKNYKGGYYPAGGYQRLYKTGGYYPPQTGKKPEGGYYPLFGKPPKSDYKSPAKTPEYTPEYKDPVKMPYRTPYHPQYAPDEYNPYRTPYKTPAKTTQRPPTGRPPQTPLMRAVPQKDTYGGAAPPFTRSENVPGYNALIKRVQEKTGKGNYRSRGYERANPNPLSYNEAFILAATMTDTYTNRSFRIEKANAPAPRSMLRQSIPEPLAEKFRAQKNNPRVYVEKTRHAIDHLPEKQGIPYKSHEMRRQGLFSPKRKKKQGRWSL